jgi:hypothetical protein
MFGANGQDGYYLAEACRLNKIEPIGVSRPGNWLTTMCRIILLWKA